MSSKIVISDMVDFPLQNGRDWVTKDNLNSSLALWRAGGFSD